MEDGEKRTMQAVIGLHLVELGTLLQRGSLDPDVTYPWRDRREIVEAVYASTSVVNGSRGSTRQSSCLQVLEMAGASKVCCSDCGSTNVQVVKWVESNTGVVIDMYSSDYRRAYENDFTWCSDCEEHTELWDEETEGPCPARAQNERKKHNG